MKFPVADRAVSSAMFKGSLLGMAAALLLSGTAACPVSGDAVRIGVLTDMNGNLSAAVRQGIGGRRDQMAVDDFGGQVLGQEN